MTALPPVTADVAAAALELLPTRLRKRVDAAAAKAANWPVEGTETGVLVRVDESTTVTLTTTAGVVASADAAVCGCLLAPACLHRAVVLTLAPLAEEPAPAEPEGEPGAAEEEEAGPGAVEQAEGEPRSAEQAQGEPRGASGSGTVEGPGEDTRAASLTPEQSAAARALHSAATAVLAAGVSGSGAAHRTTLLHAAHSARVAGLHRASAAAVRVARRLGEATAEDPAFRLSELTAELAGLLDVAHRLGSAPDRALVGAARRGYVAHGSLRLYGLFSEPVVTASGYAGAVTYALTRHGDLHSLSDVAPGDADRVPRAAGSSLPGGGALTLRELGDRGGAILTDATLSPDGRIGGGGTVRSVRASGADWYEEPLDALWRRPPAEQMTAALQWSARPAEDRATGGDLLFLTGTITREGFAVDNGPTVRLLAPDERAELPYAENVLLLAGAHGLCLRLVGRPAADRPHGIRVVAAAWHGADGETFRMDLGLRRLNRTHLPKASTAVPAPGPGPAPDPGPAPGPTLPTELDLLRRLVDRAVAGGRTVIAVAADTELPYRLRSVGLVTGAGCAQAMTRAAADRRHDPLGRLRPSDPEAYAHAWLAAFLYASAATTSLLTAAWTPEAVHALE
ncbi:hypothetical protein ABT173_26095 [Streptomyces sp. NPDC001795]|uniref:hypothetical protein n=1 Tax=unclassified Streptomyces TaxID=2593676 RepID=UPI0033317E8A